MVLNRYRELRWVWALLIALTAMLLPSMIVSFVIGAFAKVQVTINGGDYIATVTQYMGAISLLSQMLTIVLIPFLFWLLYRRPLRQMGFYKKNWFGELLLGCGLGILSIGLVFGILLLTGQATIDAADWRVAASPAFLRSLLLFILVGFSEEILSRGFMMTAMKTTRNPWLIVLVPSLVFSLLHGANPNVTALSLVNLFLAGVLFSLLFVRSGKLWVPIGYHITWNFFQGNIFGMAVSGGETTSIIRSRFVGANWVTGGAFGAEGGVVVTAALALSILGLLFLVKPPAGQVWTYDSDLPLVRLGRGQTSINR